MSKTTSTENKALVLDAFNTLFNKRDYEAAERFWSDRYIQHSAHIAPGRAGLFDLIRSAPETLRYENHLIMAEGDYVIAHGRFSRATAALPPGSPPTSSVSKTGSSPSTGTSSRMRRLAQSQRVVCQCSALGSPSERGLNPEQTICIRTSRSHQCA